jgi:hypothetical protein
MRLLDRLDLYRLDGNLKSQTSLICITGEVKSQSECLQSIPRLHLLESSYYR